LTHPTRGRDVQYRQHLLARQEADHWSVEALHRHRQCLFDQMQVGDITMGSELEKRTNCCEPDVTTANRVVAIPLQMVKETGQERLGEVGQLQDRRRLAQALLSKAQQERERITVTRHSARAECTLLHHVVGKELLHE